MTDRYVAARTDASASGVPTASRPVPRDSVSAQAPISEFEQSLDDMLYAAYTDGRADERDELIKVVQALDTPNCTLFFGATVRQVIYAMERAGK